MMPVPIPTLNLDKEVGGTHGNAIGAEDPDLEQWVRQRAYFMFINGESADPQRNYLKALNIELAQLG